MVRMIALLMLLCITGHATAQLMEAPPRAKQPLDVIVSTAAKSNPRSNIIYQVPESNTFIAVSANISRSADVAGTVGGPIVGTIAALAIVSSGFSEAMDWTRDATKGHEKSLTVNMVDLTSSILGAKIKEFALENELRIGTGAAAKGTPSLSLVPYVILGYVTKSELRPFVFFDAVLRDESGSEVWKTSYIGVTKDDRTLTGEDGWSSSSGKPLRDAVARATEHALDTAVRDLAGKLPRASGRDARIKTQWPIEALSVYRDRPGRLIESKDAAMVFATDSVGIFSGVYTIPKGLAVITTPDR